MAKMKKILALALCLFSIYSHAESNTSRYLKKLPKKCYAKHIIREISLLNPNWLELEFRQQFNESYINNYTYYLPQEVVDIKNVETVKRDNKQLVCQADLVTDKGSRPYTIIFSENSVGQIIVSYNMQLFYEPN
ncbi:hypothetical protein BKG95_10735 [Rodentibacter pneumotropicus]|uniref:DUF3887 domain-containing protein n=2 Tax=Rodentibacter pneumotropicus TaxID=758 RepID=A0AAW5LCS8_9PAST|nr:hypothetical protein [Rodentibacter pneumotropicus]MCQ9121358.1 hypothetical protein [Rodentibacter pneumotropicus]OOF66397.1 hypothetical protein BKG95_10735 [Rodentibacter pneumotropicus]